MTIQEVYEKYRQLDNLLSDDIALQSNFMGAILFDLWQAVKETKAKQDALRGFIADQKDLDPEIVRLVDKHFFDLA